MENERDAWFFLNRIPDLGPIRFHRLLQAAGSAVAILEMDIRGLQSAEVPLSIAENWARAFRDARLHKALEDDRKRMQQGVIQAVTEREDAYPSALRELVDRPPVLYYQGQWPLPEHGCVGLVGTRRATPYGLAVAQRLAADLSRIGLVTVSGLASGIDTAVHRATLDAQGQTIAVLGNGLGHVFPPENRRLQERIARQGLVVSEFPYEVTPDARHFPRRNRIISGLSRGIVVIEAGEHSGALITARYAAEQGRDVFAVPGSVMQGAHAGSHRLLKQGAKLVECAADIWDEWDLTRPTDFEAAGTDVPAPPAGRGGCTPLERRVLGLLSDDPVSIERIADTLAEPIDLLIQALLGLELKGKIRHLPGQHYVINPTF